MTTPVLVEVTVTEYIPVPQDLTAPVTKSLIPERFTYGEAIELWSDDRAVIDKLNGQMQAIRSLAPQALLEQ